MVQKLGMGCIGLSLILLVVPGCGDSRPEGMPKLYPAKVTITQDGSPLADATVGFVSENSALTRWPAGGVTDANGIATIHTYGQYPGAPEGSFKVIVTKTINEGDPMPTYPGGNATPDQMREYDRALKTGNFAIFQVVHKDYRIAKTSKLQADVKSSGANEFTFDIGKAVKEKDAAASATAQKPAEYEAMGQP